MRTDVETLEQGPRPDSRLGTEKARKRFIINVCSNLAYIGAQTAATLWLTPFLIGHLGIAAFGVIALANSIVSYLSILTTALYSAVSRFLAIELERGDAYAANKTFNTALFAMVGVFAALSPLILFVAIRFPSLFGLPSSLAADAGWLFATLVVAFFVTIITSIFAVSAFAYSQFVLSNAAYFCGLLARISLIIALFSVLPPRLWYIGVSMLIASLFTLLGQALLWRKLTPGLNVDIAAFDRSRMQPLLGMGGWLVINMIGAMLLSRVDLIVVNAYFGAAVMGGYAAVIQLSPLIEYMVNAAATVIRPFILVKYALGDFTGLRNLALTSIKMLGLGLALPVGLLCGFSYPLLTIWLGQSYGHLSALLIVAIFHLSLNLSVRPLLDVQNAFNRVRWPGIATLLSGIATLGLAIALAMWGQWGPIGVAAACAVAWTAKNAIYMPLYTAHIMKLSWWTFMPSLSSSVLGTLFVAIAAYSITLVRMPDSWLTLIGSVVIVSALYVMVVWVIGLSSTERQLVKDAVPTRAFELRRIPSIIMRASSE